MNVAIDSSPMGNTTPTSVAKPGHRVVQGAGNNPVPGSSPGMVMTGGLEASLSVRSDASGKMTAKAMQAAASVRRSSEYRIGQQPTRHPSVTKTSNPHLGGGTGCSKEGKRKRSVIGHRIHVAHWEERSCHGKALWRQVAARSQSLQDGVHALRDARFGTPQYLADLSHRQ